MTITTPAPAARRSRAAGALDDIKLFLLAIAVIAIHVIDDSFLQPAAGTSPGDHLLSGLVPLSFLAAAAWAYPRLRGGGRGALALFFGPLGIAAGIEAVHYTRELGPSGDDFTGLLCVPAGLLLLGLGAVTLWRTRRTEGSLWWRYPRRALIGVACIPAAMVVIAIGISYGDTHLARAVVPPDELRVPHEDVKFETSDGLELEGWYIPSRNGAAVISFPSRKGPQEQARMLARHGYGVLLFDRRGEGASDGDPNTFGWGGDRDIKAAIDFLQRRPDVDPDRIGGIGLSVGGELMLETAAETDELAAVVSEGAGARVFSERADRRTSALNRAFNVLPNAVQQAALTVFSNESPPANLKDLVGRIAPRPLLLIAAPNSPNGERLNRGYLEAAGEPKALWEIPESRHIGGIDARPQEYERRVVGFFDEALAP
jgi:MYXO-CTERM domain-containing protein